MNVAIDITTLLDQYSSRGIGIYTKKLLNILLQDKSINWHLIGFLDKKTNISLINKDLLDNSNIYFHSIGPVKLSTITNIFTSRKIFNQLKLTNPDIFFSPNFERGIFKGPWKNVVTIHDMIPIATNTFSQKSKIHNFFKGLFYKYQLNKIKLADAIITNSEYSKNQIEKYLGINSSKIYPIPLAKGISDTEEIKREKLKAKLFLETSNIKGEYFLYYGGLEKNKNIENLLKAFSILNKQYKKIKLVIISSDFKSTVSGRIIPQTSKAKKISKLIQKLHIDAQVICLGKVTSTELLLLLKNAFGFVHLSLHEGFGLAVLEALSQGIPSIISDIPVYRENFEGGALFTNPTNPKDIYSAFCKLLDNKKLRNKLCKDAKKISENFSWEKTAGETKDIFKKVTNIVSQKQQKKEEVSRTENKEQTKIAFVIPHFYPFKGGAENYTLNIARHFAQKDKNVEVYTSTNKPNQTKRENYRGIQILRSATLIDSYYLRFYPGLFSILMNSDADILHVQGFGFIWQDFCLIIKKFFSRKKIKYINTPHGPFMARKKYKAHQMLMKNIYTWIQRLFLNWLYDLVIADNHQQSSWIHKEYGINLDKIKYLPIGIPKDHFKSSDLKEKNSVIKELGITSNTTVMSYLGRFHKYKGIHHILKALKKVKEKYEDFLFVFMGSDSGELKFMKKFIIENRLENNVKIIEKPTDQKRNTVLDISEIFVFPSWWEAFGISMVEAMAHKNAIISSKTEGGLHLIQNKKNGILVSYANIQQLQLAIIRLLKDEKLRNKCIKNNYEKAELLVWEKLWPEYNSIYQINGKNI
ncbi:glycosyltransferase [Candidatus Dojkabacteria bacterium]|nr:glycosyltransferase [Candidatus Dojkabacteria bacterium]